MVKKNLKVKELTNISSRDINIEVLGIHITGLSEELVIVAFYRKPGEIVTTGSWLEILGQVRNVISALGERDAYIALPRGTTAPWYRVPGLR